MSSDAQCRSGQAEFSSLPDGCERRHEISNLPETILVSLPLFEAALWISPSLDPKCHRYGNAFYAEPESLVGAAELVEGLVDFDIILGG